MAAPDTDRAEVRGDMVALGRGVAWLIGDEVSPPTDPDPSRYSELCGELLAALVAVVLSARAAVGFLFDALALIVCPADSSCRRAWSAMVVMVMGFARKATKKAEPWPGRLAVKHVPLSRPARLRHITSPRRMPGEDMEENSIKWGKEKLSPACSARSPIRFKVGTA